MTEVVGSGACSGFLRVGDKLTHVDNKSVEGKAPSDVVALCSSLLSVLLTIERKTNGASKTA